jgi:hypothetical protein
LPSFCLKKATPCTASNAGHQALAPIASTNCTKTRIPTTTLKMLVAEMVQADFIAAKRDALVKMAGFKT